MSTDEDILKNGTSSKPAMPIHDIKVRLRHITTAATVTGPVLFPDTVHSEKYTAHILTTFFETLTF